MRSFQLIELAETSSHLIITFKTVPQISLIVDGGGKRKKRQLRTSLKWYSVLKKYLDINNYNAALRWYTCTHTVYSLFNDIWVTVEWEIKQQMQVGSSVAAISPAISAGPVYFHVRGNKLSHRKLAINWQLCNFDQKQSKGLLIWKWWIKVIFRL